MSLSPYVSSIKLEGKTIQIETGALARQSDAAVLVSCGDDQVLATVVSSKEKSDLDFLPLTVECQDRLYAIGKIPGNYFRREGRPTHSSVLSGRMIDRPLRPCFPEGYAHEIQIVVTVLSSSGEVSLNALSCLAASSALHVSNIPFNGPVASVQIAKKGDKWLVNPGSKDLEADEGDTDGSVGVDLNMVVSGGRLGLLMVEGELGVVSEKVALEALTLAHKHIQPLLDLQDDLRKKSGSTPKREYEALEIDKDWRQQLETFLTSKVQACLAVKDKVGRQNAFSDLKQKAEEHFIKEEDDTNTVSLKKRVLGMVFDELKYNQARNGILKGSRIDGRKNDEVRPITSKVGLLKRVHGSSLFTRGETQVLGAVTLGTDEDGQLIEDINGVGQKKFFLHYNFPPYCVGEVGRLGGQSRREIGHGFLAEKALKVVLPKGDVFPYSIRLASEVLESNGSSSMGTVCAGSMALLDAGVPLKSGVAGIAMGLIQEEGKVAILSDILGDEDHLGDMDFKVAGTSDGITALQMDIKAKSVSFEVIEKALAQAKAGRLHILNEMEKTIAKGRENLSAYAPRIEVMHIKRKKIREVIGASGKMINRIIEETGAKVSINDDGRVCISSSSMESTKKAQKMIEDIVSEAEEGKVYEGKVVKVVLFGAFVEILPGVTGLLHISEIANERVNQVTDYVKEGDTVKVKVVEITKDDKIRLSRKVLL